MKIQIKNARMKNFIWAIILKDLSLYNLKLLYIIYYQLILLIKNFKLKRHN